LILVPSGKQQPLDAWFRIFCTTSTAQPRRIQPLSERSFLDTPLHPSNGPRSNSDVQEEGWG
jgi:hypothetical protein